jgi:hypothetical protein
MELIRRLYGYQESHMGMLVTAEFGALTAEHARPIRLNPGTREIPLYQVPFAMKVWHPEAVNDIL